MQFQVKAVRIDKGVARIVALDCEVRDAAEARARALAQGYSVLAVRARESLPARIGRRGPRFPLVLFSQELLTLMQAGLTVVDALETLSERDGRGDARAVLQQVIAGLREGRSLSAALQALPAAFPPLYVATVRASERTGDLAEAMTRFVAYQTQMDLVRKKVVSASIYPIVLMTAGALVTLFLMTYVVPRFSRIYEDIGTGLPLMSRLLLNWGSLLEAHGVAVAAAVAGLVVAVAALARRPQTKAWLMHRLWQVPAIGARMRVYQLARFYRTLGMLLRGGIPVAQALTMVSDLLQSALRGHLQQAAACIGEGQSISSAMQANQLTTPVAQRLLKVGERSGQMGEMMERIAGFYDEEMARWIDWFTRLLEPVLMAFIGLMIGLIVVLMYMPVFELAGSLN